MGARGDFGRVGSGGRMPRAVIVCAAAYAIIWVACVAWYWLGIVDATSATAGSAIFAYILVTHYVALPAAAFAIGTVVGWRRNLGRVRFAVAPALAIAYALAPIVTFSISNALGLSNIAEADLMALAVGLVPVALGLAVGAVARSFSHRA